MLTYFRHSKKEYSYFLILCFLILLLKVFDKDNPYIHWNEILLVLIYCSGAIFINYFLFPRFFTKGKLNIFFLLFVLSIVFVVAFEEFVFEKIFYPNTKGDVIYISGALIEIIPIFAILVGYKIVWDAYERQNKIDHLKRLVAESELQNFNSQISPHFLFNNLNTIYAYAIENSTKTPTIILQLSGILRYMLYDCKEKLVPIKNEIENLNNYINLNKIQLDKRGKIDFEYPKDLEGFYISPLILIVFVENAFKHSASSQTDNIYISIKIEINNNKLNFNCKNTFEEKSNEENLPKGIGLNNVTNRLNLIYPNKHDLNVTSYVNTYIVSLMIDLKND